MFKPTLCECGRPIVVKFNGRYRKPHDRDHDLCMRCYGAEVERARAHHLFQDGNVDRACD